MVGAVRTTRRAFIKRDLLVKKPGVLEHEVQMFHHGTQLGILVGGRLVRVVRNVQGAEDLEEAVSRHELADSWSIEAKASRPYIADRGSM